MEQNLIYLFSAYTIIWIVLFGYLFVMSQQVSDLRSQLDSLRRQRHSDEPASERPASEPS